MELAGSSSGTGGDICRDTARSDAENRIQSCAKLEGQPFDVVALQPRSGYARGRE